jgi:hypothetical protein
MSTLSAMLLGGMIALTPSMLYLGWLLWQEGEL